jgi:hypothetical protein
MMTLMILGLSADGSVALERPYPLAMPTLACAVLRDDADLIRDIGTELATVFPHVKSVKLECRRDVALNGQGETGESRAVHAHARPRNAMSPSAAARPARFAPMVDAEGP